MSRRAKEWLVGGWLVLVVAGWSFTESINDGIEPTSGPRPEASSSPSPKCPVPSQSADFGRDVDRYFGDEADFVAIAVTC